MASPTADRLMTWFSSFFQASSVSAGEPQSLDQLQQMWMDKPAVATAGRLWSCLKNSWHRPAVAGSACAQGSDVTRQPLLPGQYTAPFTKATAAVGACDLTLEALFF